VWLVVFYMALITLGFAAQKNEADGPSVKSHYALTQPLYTEVVNDLHHKTSYWKNIHERCEAAAQGFGTLTSLLILYQKKPMTIRMHYMTGFLGGGCLGLLNYSKFAYRQYVHYQHDLNAVLKFNHQPGFIYGTEEDLDRTSNQD
jgi:hypothetical protein